MTSISGSTRLTGIIGWPVEHSLSPAIHNAAFAATGLDMAYVALPVAPWALGAAVAGLAALGFVGVNVTIPHKSAVVALLDEVADEAAAIRAVNTIVVRDGRLLGYNTDVGGFVQALREVVPEGVAGADALLLGAGGAARAAAVGLVRLGVRRLVVADRTPARAAELLELVIGGPHDAERRGGLAESPGVGQGSGAGAGQRVEGHVVALDALTPADVTGADLLVNATSLGMSGALKVPDVLVDNIQRGHIVYDVVYGKRPTKPLERARAVGARAVDGLGMLAWQAALAFELWTGRPAPLDVMRSAAR